MQMGTKPRRKEARDGSGYPVLWEVDARSGGRRAFPEIFALLQRADRHAGRTALLLADALCEEAGARQDAL